MEIVIVPAWRRPGFLAAALRCLEAADDGDLVYWIGLDRGHNREVMRVAQEFVSRFGARAGIKPRMHPYRGNSYNVLSLYREALEAAPDLVHLVEEDIFVGADYYTYHRSAHKLAPSAFAVSAARNQDIPGDPEPVADQAYLAMRYQSIAVSFHPERLDLVVPHMRAEYFRDPVAYCRRSFPRTRIPPANAEQDGLLNRIVEDQRMYVVYPTQPRAYHAGFVGYHRAGEQLVGTAEQQADRLLSMSTEQLNAAAHSYPDHQAIDLGARFGEVSSVISWPAGS